MTILHFGPFYSFGARIPLYLGYLGETLRNGGAIVSPWVFLSHPILTDFGVYSLIVVQHATLFLTARYLISGISRRFLVQLALSVVWASNPIAYTFAHTVGSETASLLELFLAYAIGLRLVTLGRPLRLRDWRGFAVVFWLSILTRQVNGTLGVLMPVAFTVLWFARYVVSRRGSSGAIGSSRKFPRRELRNSLVAIAVGASCICAASVTVKALAWTAGVAVRSRHGPTFLVRLKFLTDLTASERNAFIHRVTDRLPPKMRPRTIAFLSETYRGGQPWDVFVVDKRARQLLLAERERSSDLKIDQAYNRLANACLFPPDRDLLRGALHDFVLAAGTDASNVTETLFSATSWYYWGHEMMPGCAGLNTFRGRDAESIDAVYHHRSYFHWWSWVDFKMIVIGTGVLCCIGSASGRRRQRVLLFYSVAVLITGFVMMLLNCCFTEFLPRFTMLVWVPGMAGLLIALGTVLELATSRVLIVRRVNSVTG